MNFTLPNFDLPIGLAGLFGQPALMGTDWWPRADMILPGKVRGPLKPIRFCNRVEE